MTSIYSVGPCPVCAEFGAALVVRAFQSGTVFLLCPSCGAAWNPPAPTDVRDFRTPDEIAPDGVTLPSRAEISASSIGSLDVEEVSFERWWQPLSEFLIDKEE